MKGFYLTEPSVPLTLLGGGGLITFLRKVFNEAEHVFLRIAGE